MHSPRTIEEDLRTHCRGNGQQDSCERRPNAGWVEAGWIEKVQIATIEEKAERRLRLYDGRALALFLRRNRRWFHTRISPKIVDQIWILLFNARWYFEGVFLLSDQRCAEFVTLFLQSGAFDFEPFVFGANVLRVVDLLFELRESGLDAIE